LASLRDAGNTLEVPAFPVSPVDTVGAGDTFAGAVATALTDGMVAMEAIRFANAAGALATLAAGAQEAKGAIPDRSSIVAFLERL